MSRRENPIQAAIEKIKEAAKTLTSSVFLLVCRARNQSLLDNLLNYL